MHRLTVLVPTIALVLATSLTAATPVIGVVQASGQFRVNQAIADGTATLFDGAVLETTDARTDVALKSGGGHIALAPNSKARVFTNHMALESGAADVNAPGYSIEVASLSISGAGGQVVLDSPGRVRVGATSHALEVRNAKGTLLARVHSGHALEFDRAFDSPAQHGGQSGASVGSPSAAN